MGDERNQKKKKKIKLFYLVAQLLPDPGSNSAGEVLC